MNKLFNILAALTIIGFIIIGFLLKSFDKDIEFGFARQYELFEVEGRTIAVDLDFTMITSYNRKPIESKDTLNVPFCMVGNKNVIAYFVKDIATIPDEKNILAWTENGTLVIRARANPFIRSDFNEGIMDLELFLNSPLTQYVKNLNE